MLHLIIKFFQTVSMKSSKSNYKTTQKSRFRPIVVSAFELFASKHGKILEKHTKYKNTAKMLVKIERVSANK